ncbi:hypothetical protein [Conexibacter sp. SYSU D00693]|uniref:hypothetical protein n=1 Tax=Conexibacter sp. SYSU D00693 TaxID=2812560 RepID=UPI00196A72F4|nr:hypothetical protein [Conexibacter sp. SYSU D00693]
MSDAVAIAVANHPRARRHVRKARGFGGLIAFALAFLFARRAGLGADDAALRALMAGFAGSLVCWGFAVLVWRQLVMAELEVARRRVLARRAERRAAAEAAAAAESA